MTTDWVDQHGDPCPLTNAHGHNGAPNLIFEQSIYTEYCIYCLDSCHRTPWKITSMGPSHGRTLSQSTDDPMNLALYLNDFNSKMSGICKIVAKVLSLSETKSRVCVCHPLCQRVHCHRYRHHHFPKQGRVAFLSYHTQ